MSEGHEQLQPETAIVAAMLINPSDTARMLGLKNAETLAVWRATKRYPLRFVKIGAKVMYRLKDIEAFIESRTVSGDGSPTDEQRVPRKRRNRGNGRGHTPIRSISNRG